MTDQVVRFALANKEDDGKITNVVESTDFPGIFGPVVLNPDGSNITNKTTLEKIQTASDYKQTYTFLDPGTANERISTIVHSSVSLGLSLTETYVWAGVSPNYYLSTSTFS